MNRRSLERVASDLARARGAFERIQAGTFAGTPIYRLTPGCTRGCRQCDIACAVTVGAIHDLENELSAACAAQAGPISFIITEEGHA